MNKKVVVNYFYNMIYQITSILVPIITIPYISRVFTPKDIGINGYTYAIAILFSGIAIFGINNYGSKNIAYVRNSKEKLTNKFWSIWILQFCTSVISILGYLLIFVFIDKLNMKFIFIMQFPFLLATLFDISWFYIGIEDFKKTVTRNVLVKIIGLILIFVLVKNESDLWIYVLINSMSAFIGNITFWIFIFRYINIPKLKNIEVREHIKGAFILLIPQLAIQLYTTLDRVVVGGLSNLTEVGYYDQSQKIVRISLTFVTALSIVLMPRIANMFANNDREKIEEYIKKSLNFTMAFSIFIAASIAAVSKHFVPIFFSEEFIVIIPYMMLASLIVIFISVGGVFANQFALPTGKNKEYITPLILAGIINILSNILLVPKLGALGGVIAIVFTEVCVVVLRIFLVRKFLNLKYIFKGTWVYILAGISSFIVTYGVSNAISGGIKAVLIEAIVSVVVFIIIIGITKNPLSELVIPIIKNKTKVLSKIG